MSRFGFTQAGGKYATPRAKLRAQERGIPLDSVNATGPDNLIIERDVLAYQPVAASPLARKVASLSGISLDSVEGSGARGKVMAADVQKALSAQAVDGTAERLETVIPMNGMRRGIANSMRSSLDTAAQANHSMLVDMSECVRLRKRLKDAEINISLNDIVIRCTAKALEEHPQINAVRQENNIIQSTMSMLASLLPPARALVPVVTDANKKTLQEIAGATKVLAEKAKSGTITPDELTQGTFTVTNLGMLGVDRFVAILNPPESGILAVGAMKKQPVVLEDDSIGVRPMMWLTLTYDHCVIDGAPFAFSWEESRNCLRILCCCERHRHEQRFDVAVLGGGGGCSGHPRAQYGLRTALIESGELGALAEPGLSHEGAAAWRRVWETIGSRQVWYWRFRRHDYAALAAHKDRCVSALARR